jgi:hypothetical protein
MLKKFYALVISLTLLVSSVSFTTSAAYGVDLKPGGAYNLFETLKDTNKLIKSNSSLPSETVLSDRISDLNILLNNENTKILSSYGINTYNVKNIRTVRENRNARVISKVEFDNKSEIGFDTNNKIVSISNFKDSAQQPQQSIVTVNSSFDLSDLINDIEKNGDLTVGYKLMYSEAFDEDYWKLEWERIFDNAIINPYDSVKVIVDRKDKSIVAYNKFCMTPNTTQPVISENEALTSALPVLDTITNIENKTVTLTTTRPNFLWATDGPYEQADCVRLAYKIGINNESAKIYIDAVTGENLGGDISLSSDSKVFGVAALPYVYDNSNLAHNGMASLGYNMLPQHIGDDVSVGQDIINYWHSSTAYGFYVQCHADQTTITDNVTWALTNTQVVGNWHFVFLNGCSTAADTRWASSFKIYGYSKRAFLGWSANVDTVYVNLFSIQFWPEVVNGTHSNNVRDAAVWAANQVPGSGTTPIKFYGDTTYNGRAY